MAKLARVAVITLALSAAAIAGAVVFVPPKKALSASLMRNCIEVITPKLGLDSSEIISVAAIQPAINETKIESLTPATQTLVRRGDVILSEPEVLLEYRGSSGPGQALCTYHVTHWVNKGAFDARLHDAQVGLTGMSNAEILMTKAVRVGYFARFVAIFPIFGTEQKHMLD